MRVTIIPVDGFVSVDGLTFNEIDLSFIPSNQHAIHWYNNVGEVEIKDDNGRIVENQKIETFDFYQPAIDSWNIKKQEYEESLKPVPDTPETIKNKIIAATQFRLDSFAQTRNYDGILSACTYATSTNDKFRIEVQYCVEVRDSTWAKLYQIMSDVEQGIRPMPQNYEEIEQELPPLIWPN